MVTYRRLMSLRLLRGHSDHIVREIEASELSMAEVREAPVPQGYLPRKATVVDASQDLPDPDPQCKP